MAGTCPPAHSSEPCSGSPWGSRGPVSWASASCPSAGGGGEGPEPRATSLPSIPTHVARLPLPPVTRVCLLRQPVPCHSVHHPLSDRPARPTLGSEPPGGAVGGARGHPPPSRATIQRRGRSHPPEEVLVREGSGPIRVGLWRREGLASRRCLQRFCAPGLCCRVPAPPVSSFSGQGHPLPQLQERDSLLVPPQERLGGRQLPCEAVLPPWSSRVQGLLGGVRVPGRPRAGSAAGPQRAGQGIASQPPPLLAAASLTADRCSRCSRERT